MEKSTKQAPANTLDVTLAVVILNYRTPDFVTDCLVTLLPELANLDAKVVVVDNDSPDDSSEIICAWLKQNDSSDKAVFVQSDTNGGFAAGNNVGIKAISAKYYLLLNSDTLVREGSIQVLLDTAAEFPESGLYSPRLEWPDSNGQESCFRYPTPISEFMRAAQTGFIDRMFSNRVVAMPVQSEVAHPKWTSFACIMICAQVIEDVGLLDEGYFMYFEDIEFCHRALKSSWNIAHNPLSKVVHLRGGSSPVKKRKAARARLPKYYYESRTRFFYQSYGKLGLLAANFLWSAGRLISLLRQLLGRSDKAAVESEWKDVWINFNKPLGQYTHPSS